MAVRIGRGIVLLRILNKMEIQYKKHVKIICDLKIGDIVRIADGPFKDFEGKVSDIDEERGKIKALVSMFGRETPVEIDFLQVKKI